MKIVLSMLGILALCTNMAKAVEPVKDSWTQWGGPNRDHKSLASGLKQEWPTGGPKLVWSAKTAGMGYSSIAVSEGRCYTLGAKEGKNYVQCLDATSGQQVWQTETGEAAAEKTYATGWGAGPRSTPTVVSDRIVVLDDMGNCCCLTKSDGKLIWKKNLIADLGGSMPNWGYSESPLVDGDRVVVCPGGANFLVAFNLNTGETVLKSTGYAEKAHYVSVIKHSVNGLDAYTTACGKGLVSFATDDGRMLWSNSLTGAGTATIPTPIIVDNRVYHTAGYGAGCVLLKLSRSGKNVTAEEVWANKNQSNHHGGVVLHNGTIYGFKPRSGWIAQDFSSGEAKFQEPVKDEAGGSLAFADGRLYVYGEKTGNCYLVEPSPSAWTVKGQLSLPEKSGLNRGRGQIWAHPVIAEGKLFLRDLDLIYAFDIAK